MILDYNVEAILASGNKLDVLVCKIDEKKYIVNNIKGIVSNYNLFREIFEFSKLSSEVKFWVDSNDYSIAFKHASGIPISEMFADGKYSMNYEKKLQLLSNILIEINSNSNMPFPIKLAISSCENILIGNDYFVSLQPKLSEKFLESEHDTKKIYENIADIISVVLAAELKLYDNRHLKIVVDKCRNGLFSSIPEIIYELNHTTVTEGDANIFKLIVTRSKKYLSKLPVKKLASVSLVLIIGIYLYSIIANSQVQVTYKPTNKIGNLHYATDEVSNNQIVLDPVVSTNKTQDIPLSISANETIDFDTYIIKPKDTLQSICKNFYPDERFIEAISSYNSLETSTLPPAGTIIKLPKAQAVIEYHIA